jgi:citronellol/citronellal dehydrogenase
MTSLKGKTVLVSGGSRGIGLAIAVRAARDGAQVAVLGKTGEPNPKLPGTLYSAASEVERAGGTALPIVCDIRSDEQVTRAVDEVVARFGGIDVCVNNASAISPTTTPATDMKRYDLMHDINVRGTFLVSKTCLPHLMAAANPHILTLSPPLDMAAHWFAPHLAYTMSKMAMSMVTLGLAEELAAHGVAVNSLWPLTTIDTAAVRNLLGGAGAAASSRTAEIVADAAHVILTRPARDCTGNFFIDEEVLREEGVTDFERYAVTPGAGLTVDFFVPRGSLAHATSALRNDFEAH